MTGQNYYEGVIPEGTEVMVPVRCACPTGNQTRNGVTALSVYMVEVGDTIDSIANTFGAEIQSLFEANSC